MSFASIYGGMVTYIIISKVRVCNIIINKIKNVY